MTIEQGYKNPLVSTVAGFLDGGEPTPVSIENPLPTKGSTLSSAAQSLVDGALMSFNGTAPATSAKYTAIQVYNPVDSGKLILLDSVQGWNSTGTMTWTRILKDDDLDTPIDVTVAQNNNTISDIVPIVKVRYKALDALSLDQNLRTVSVTSTTSLGASVSSNSFTLDEGYCLQFEGNTVNVGMSIIGTCREVSK